MEQTINVFWFRRDLRLTDNAGLYHALRSGLPVLAVFVFDSLLLDELPDRKDRRVSFIYQHLQRIEEQLNGHGSALHAYYGTPAGCFEELRSLYHIHTVFANHDYEPYARTRDEAVRRLLATSGIAFSTYKDQVIFEKEEVTREGGLPYSVFTPYAKKWLSLLNGDSIRPYPSERFLSRFLARRGELPALSDLGFGENGLHPGPRLDSALLSQYDQTRNIPSLKGTSGLGVHLRFGTISIRRVVDRAQALNAVFLKELIWREFFMQLLWHFPRLVGEACKEEYDSIRWRNDEKEFQLWCEGRTGYPLVDAGMRELNATGFMHNRVRMTAASFLVKHLLIDWRWGEAYFAEKLLDYELASNNGNWQWVAGCGCDAAPYFRIFNPQLQAKKFDPEGLYVKKWVPELNSLSYPPPVVEHSYARERCLKAYRSAVQSVR